MVHDTIENPVTGECIAFRERADDPTVDGVAFDYHLPPGGLAVGKLDHVHPEQEERFEVRSGRLGVRGDGDEWTATPGTRFAILPGTPHAVWNDGDGEMHATVEIRPALDVDSFFETTFGLARDGRGSPGPLQLAVLAHTYRREFSLAAVPESLQRGLAALAAPVGRLAGYRGHYDRYDATGGA